MTLMRCVTACFSILLGASIGLPRLKAEEYTNIDGGYTALWTWTHSYWSVTNSEGEAVDWVNWVNGPENNAVFPTSSEVAQIGFWGDPIVAGDVLLQQNKSTIELLPYPLFGVFTGDSFTFQSLDSSSSSLRINNLILNAEGPLLAYTDVTFHGDAVFNANAKNAVFHYPNFYRGNLHFFDDSVMNTNAPEVISNVVGNENLSLVFNDNSTLNVNAARLFEDAWSNHAVYVTDTGTLNVNAADGLHYGSFLLQSQSVLNAHAEDALSGGGDGHVILYDNSVLNAHVKHALSGGYLDLRGNAVLNVLAEDAIASEVDIAFSENGGIRLNGHGASVGRIFSSAPGSFIENAHTDDAVLTARQTANSTFHGTLRDGTGGGALGLAKEGEGTFTLTGNNTYSGGTRIFAGVLEAAHDNALGTGAVRIEGGALEVGHGVSISNPIFLAGGRYIRTVSGDLTDAIVVSSGFETAPVTSARLLAGTTDVQLTLSSAFMSGSDAFNDAIRVGNVFTLEGTGSTLFVLQLSLAASRPGAVLGWLDGDGLWVNAVEGNTGNSADFEMRGYLGSYAQFTREYDDLTLSDYLGAYGYDPETGAVWAVLNHNSSFAMIIPEPATTVLLIGGGMLISAFARRRSHMPKAPHPTPDFRERPEESPPRGEAPRSVPG